MRDVSPNWGGLIANLKCLVTFCLMFQLSTTPNKDGQNVNHKNNSRIATA